MLGSINFRRGGGGGGGGDVHRPVYIESRVCVVKEAVM